LIIGSYIKNNPKCKVFNTYDLSTTHSADFFVPFGSEDFKSILNMHDAVTNSTRIYTTIAGDYVELVPFQNSAGALLLNGGRDFTNLSIIRIGD